MVIFIQLSSEAETIKYFLLCIPFYRPVQSPYIKAEVTVCLNDTLLMRCSGILVSFLLSGCLKRKKNLIYMHKQAVYLLWVWLLACPTFLEPRSMVKSHMRAVSKEFFHVNQYHLIGRLQNTRSTNTLILLHCIVENELRKKHRERLRDL